MQTAHFRVTRTIEVAMQMPPLPALSGHEVVRVFVALGWDVVAARKSHHPGEGWPLGHAEQRLCCASRLAPALLPVLQRACRNANSTLPQNVAII